MQASKAQRLHVGQPLAEATTITLARDESHYLLNVLRLGVGDTVLLFNGRDGEWLARISATAKKTAELALLHRTRAQARPLDIRYCFAPLKRARIDFIAQKATELGVAAIQPVITRHTVAERVRLDRLAANAIEAAEQCGILWVPDIVEPVSLEAFLAARAADRPLIFCDEAAPIADPIAALGKVRRGGLDVLVGPEGGFSSEERAALLRESAVHPIALGPRVMRADTAGIAALTLVQAVLGDWS